MNEKDCDYRYKTKKERRIIDSVIRKINWQIHAPSAKKVTSVTFDCETKKIHFWSGEECWDIDLPESQSAVIKEIVAKILINP